MIKHAIPAIALLALCACASLPELKFPDGSHRIPVNQKQDATAPAKAALPARQSLTPPTPATPAAQATPADPKAAAMPRESAGPTPYALIASNSLRLSRQLGVALLR
jgi:hypothetical protein